MRDEIKQQIENDLKSNKVILYMKGTKDSPMCGFSARTVDILKEHEVPFKTVNILENEELRGALKEYSDWPTFPQLYVDGELVGGCDIVTELHGSGELTKLLGK